MVLALATPPISRTPAQPSPPLPLDPWPERTHRYPYARIVQAAYHTLRPYHQDTLWLLARPRKDGTVSRILRARRGTLLRLTPDGFCMEWDPTLASETRCDVVLQRRPGWREFIGWTDWWSGVWAIYPEDPGAIVWPFEDGTEGTP